MADVNKMAEVKSRVVELLEKDLSADDQLIKILDERRRKFHSK
jgi:hypothetical protein